MKTFDFEHDFDTDDGTIHVHAAGNVSTYSPATMYNSHGDPGDDAEGGECEYDVIEAFDEDGKEIDFPQGMFDQLDEIAIENAE